MKHVELAFALLVVVLPAPGRAQQAPDTAPAPVRIQFQKKSPVVAALLEAALPTAGYQYAGEGRRGTAPAVMTGVGAGLVVFGAVFTMTQIMSFDVSESEFNLASAAVSVGMGLYIVGRIWGVAGVYAAVSETNRLLDQRGAQNGGSGVGRSAARVQLGISLPVE